MKQRMNWVPRPMGPRWLHKWLERHQHPFNFGIHMIGIPLTIFGIVMAFYGEWSWAIIGFFGGYALQFIGHAVEGNDAGEVILLKKKLGLPYRAIVPRMEPMTGTSQSS